MKRISKARAQNLIPDRSLPAVTTLKPKGKPRCDADMYLGAMFAHEVLVKLSASLVFGAPFQDSTSEQLPLKCLINTEHAKAAHPHVRKVLQKLTGTRKRCSYISWNHVTSQISLQADQYWFVVRSRSICSPLMVRSIFLPAGPKPDLRPYLS